jgi:hypothetical protein
MLTRSNEYRGFHCSDYSPMKIKTAVVFKNIFCVNLIGLSLFFVYKSRCPIKRGDSAVLYRVKDKKRQ